MTHKEIIVRVRIIANIATTWTTIHLLSKIPVEGKWKWKYPRGYRQRSSPVNFCLSLFLRTSVQ